MVEVVVAVVAAGLEAEGHLEVLPTVTKNSINGIYYYSHSG